MEFIVCQLNLNKTVKKQKKKKKIVRFQIILRFSNKMLTTEYSPSKPSFHLLCLAWWVSQAPPTRGTYMNPTKMSMRYMQWGFTESMHC